MRPYSTDFRRKVVRAYEQGEGSQRQLARIFGVSLSFIQDLLQRYRQTGSVAPKPHGGGNPGKVGPYLGLISHLHQQQPDASLAERCERLAAAAQVYVGRTTMQRVLKHLGLTRKKRLSTPRNRIPRKGATPGPRTGRGSARMRPST
jgi:transposase